jgi:hypothetical protein
VCGLRVMEVAGFCGPCLFGCISVVIVEGVCVRDCRGWDCVRLVEYASQQVVIM